jgi:hypothetical protein
VRKKIMDDNSETKNVGEVVDEMGRMRVRSER